MEWYISVSNLIVISGDIFITVGEKEKVFEKYNMKIKKQEKGLKDEINQEILKWGDNAFDVRLDKCHQGFDTATV
ncbi:hypothetical protein KUTeg_008063 [Tegillarca granosa]|uniref:Uncharacterized protein n=1 Tax=Tegillarca granosa TaxID=220873 RepID=A0ABQ9FAV8_TEGGR|nr:hypothetical protein KUTeg_008063 [Tegillarca granosa]